MIIAVSMQVVKNTSYYEPRDAISHDWIRLLDQRGLTPLLVPNGLRDPVKFLHTAQANALLLTGGNDLGLLDLESQQSDNASEERDNTEAKLLESANSAGLPVLGICRGLQFINFHFGGKLCRDLTGLGEHVASNHTVQILDGPEPTLKKFTQVETNSFHNNGVTLDGLSDQLLPFALADNQVVEGFSHATLPITAIQWHPERPNPACELDNVIFENWLSKCA